MRLCVYNKQSTAKFNLDGLDKRVRLVLMQFWLGLHDRVWVEV